MDTTQILLIALIVIVIAGVIFIATQLKKPEKKDDSLVQMIQLLQTQLQTQISSTASEHNTKLDRTIQNINDRMHDQNRTLTDQLGKANQNVLAQFQMSQKNLKEYSDNLKLATQEITKVGETGNQIKSFATQLQSLEGILKNPKQRGILGEYFLESVLKNVMPPGTFQMQYSLGKDDKTEKELIVDAAIFVKDKIIPIDSKFSLENYNKIVVENDPIEREKLEKVFKQDLINRIDETAKYIKPEKHTMEFAFMFIPSEGVYYDILVNKSGNVKIDTEKLIEEAFRKKVLIVSPTNLLAYLQTVLQGLKALKIEESALQIINNVNILANHLGNFDKNFNRIGANIGTVVNSFNTSLKEFKKIDKDIAKISGESVNITTDEVDKPSFDL